MNWKTAATANAAAPIHKPIPGAAASESRSARILRVSNTVRNPAAIHPALIWYQARIVATAPISSVSHPSGWVSPIRDPEAPSIHGRRTEASPMAAAATALRCRRMTYPTVKMAITTRTMRTKETSRRLRSSLGECR